MEGLSALLHQYNISPENIATPQRLAIIATVCVICIIAYFIMKKIIIPVLKRMVSATSAKWDDHLLNDKVLRVVCYLVPMILLYIFLPIAFTDKPVALILIDKLCKVAIIAVCIKLVNAFISSFYHISNDYDLMRNRPLKVFYQMLKVIVIAVGLILIISIIIDKRLDILLTGLGASAAVLMLVFKDTIMGLVAGVQINAYDTLRPGDWIIMEKYGASGVPRRSDLSTEERNIMPVTKVGQFHRHHTVIPVYQRIVPQYAEDARVESPPDERENPHRHQYHTFLQQRGGKTAAKARSGRVFQGNRRRTAHQPSLFPIFRRDLSAQPPGSDTPAPPDGTPATVGKPWAAD